MATYHAAIVAWESAAGGVVEAEVDLFGERPVLPKPQGLQSWPDVIDDAQERDLIERIDEAELTPFRFQGWLGKRLTRSFGWTYDFHNGRFERGDPLPDWLLPCRDIAARFTGLSEEELVQALLIRYDPGAGIGWHKDRPVFEHVVGLSLGNSASLRFRRRKAGGFERYAHDASPRSLYRLGGEARHGWEHSIAEMIVPRWSITFRSLAV